MGIDDDRGDRLQASRVWLVPRLERMLGRDGSAEEVAQETFARALANEPDDDANLEGWLWFVAKRLAIDRIRKRRHEVCGFDELPAAPVMATQFDRLLQDEEAREVLEVLNELAEGQRICIKLSYLEGLSFERIVAVTNFTLDQVRSHIQNGRIQFRRKWEARVKKRQARSGRGG